MSRWRDGLSPEETAALDKLAERKAAGVAIYADLIAAFRRKPRTAIVEQGAAGWPKWALADGVRFEIREILED